MKGTPKWTECIFSKEKPKSFQGPEAGPGPRLIRSSKFSVWAPLYKKLAMALSEAIMPHHFVNVIISLCHSMNRDFCGHSRFVLWHENLTTFVS